MNEPLQHFARDCDWRDCATLYVLGDCGPDEARAYEEHLPACGACTEELELARETVARVDRSVVERDLERAGATGASVRERMLAQIARTPQESSTRGTSELDRTWRNWSADGSNPAVKDGLISIHAADGEWQSIGTPGIQVKRLSVDPQRRYVTMMIRMAPGTSYPSHRHAGNEECFVIAGDIKVGDRVLHAGDYQLAPEDSVHGVQSTEHGCTLLIVSSQDDELLG
jgi:anti-sigma factor ChrR (cupin superfamily)